VDSAGLVVCVNTSHRASSADVGEADLSRQLDGKYRHLWFQNGGFCLSLCDSRWDEISSWSCTNLSMHTDDQCSQLYRYCDGQRRICQCRTREGSSHRSHSGVQFCRGRIGFAIGRCKYPELHRDLCCMSDVANDSQKTWKKKRGGGVAYTSRGCHTCSILQTPHCRGGFSFVV